MWIDSRTSVDSDRILLVSMLLIRRPHIGGLDAIPWHPLMYIYIVSEFCNLVGPRITSLTIISLIYQDMK